MRQVSRFHDVPRKHQAVRFSCSCRIVLERSDLRVISKLSVKFVLMFSTPSPRPPPFVCSAFTPECVGLSRPQRTSLCAHFSLSTCTFSQHNMAHFHLQNPKNPSLLFTCLLFVRIWVITRVHPSSQVSYPEDNICPHLAAAL